MNFKTMKLSGPTQMAALGFLLGGIFNLINAVLDFSVTGITEPESLRYLIRQIITWSTFAGSILYIVVGIYLTKKKRWAHILGFILAGIALAMHIYVLSQFGKTINNRLILSIVILILLFLGREDFKK